VHTYATCRARRAVLAQLALHAVEPVVLVVLIPRYTPLSW